jgi:hypothetical protein
LEKFIEEEEDEEEEYNNNKWWGRWKKEYLEKGDLVEEVAKLK